MEKINGNELNLINGSSTFNPTICCYQLFPFLLISTPPLSYIGIHLILEAATDTGNGRHRTDASHTKLGIEK